MVRGRVLRAVLCKEFAEAARDVRTPELEDAPVTGSSRTGVLRVQYERKPGPSYSYVPGVPVEFIIGTIDWPWWDAYHQRIQAQVVFRNFNNTGGGFNARLELLTIDGGVEFPMAQGQTAFALNGSGSVLAQSEILAGTGVRARLVLDPTGAGPGRFQASVTGSMAVRLVDPGRAPLKGA